VIRRMSVYTASDTEAEAFKGLFGGGFFRV